MTQKLSADFGRRIFLEGRAFTRPQNFGTEKAAPSKLSPNKFGAQKFRHQPLAEASGMGGFRTHFWEIQRFRQRLRDVFK